MAGLTSYLEPHLGVRCAQTSLVWSIYRQSPKPISRFHDAWLRLRNSAGPDQPLFAILALDQRRIDRRRKARVIEFHGKICSSFARYLAPCRAELDRAGEQPIIGRLLGVLLG